MRKMLLLMMSLVVGGCYDAAPPVRPALVIVSSTSDTDSSIESDSETFEGDLPDQYVTESHDYLVIPLDKVETSSVQGSEYDPVDVDCPETACGLCRPVLEEVVSLPEEDEDCDGRLDEGFVGSTCDSDEDCDPELTCMRRHCTRECSTCQDCEEFVRSISRKFPTLPDWVIVRSMWEELDQEMMDVLEMGIDSCAQCETECSDIGGVCAGEICYRDPLLSGKCREEMGEERDSFQYIVLDTVYRNRTLERLSRRYEEREFCVH